MSRDFRAYWAAEVTSTFGSVFTVTAIGIVAVRSFDASAGQVGVVTAAATLPTVVFAVLSGTVADRLRRPRRVLMACDAVAALAVAAVAVGVWRGWATVWWLVALNLVLGGLSTLVEPVYFTHLGGLVDGEALVRGRARLQSGEYGANVVGRALAGPVVAVFGGAVGFAVDAASYVFSFVSLMRLRAPDRAVPRRDDEGEESLLREAAAGVRAVAGHPFLRALTGFLVAWGAIMAAITALTVSFLLGTLRIPTAWYGALFAFTGLAGLAGSLLGGRWVGRISYPVLTLGGFAGAILTSLLLPVAAGPLVVAASLAVLGIALPVFFGAIANIGLTGVLTVDISEGVLGRVLAALRTATMTAQVAGALLGGLLGDLVGVRLALWLCSVAALGSLVLATPAVRSMRPAAVPVGAAP